MASCTAMLSASLLALCGCEPAPPPAPMAADFQRAEALRPADQGLAERYERSCRICHAVPGGAPLAGHLPSWQRRLKQGDELLLAHVRDGYNAMPPRGLCSDCSEVDLRQLIHFMSRPQ